MWVRNWYHRHVWLIQRLIKVEHTGHNRIDSQQLRKDHFQKPVGVGIGIRGVGSDKRFEDKEEEGNDGNDGLVRAKESGDILQRLCLTRRELRGGSLRRHVI